MSSPTFQCHLQHPSVISNIPVSSPTFQCVVSWRAVLKISFFLSCELILLLFTTISFFSTRHRVTLGYDCFLLGHPHITSQCFNRELLTFCPQFITDPSTKFIFLTDLLHDLWIGYVFLSFLRLHILRQLASHYIVIVMWKATENKVIMIMVINMFWWNITKLSTWLDLLPDWSVMSLSVYVFGDKCYLHFWR